MLDTIDEDQIHGIRTVLENLKTYVYLHSEGYKLKDETYYIGDCDDFYVIEEDLMVSIITTICGPNSIESNLACQERGAQLGYDMMYSEDELTVNETLIKTPEIVEYLEWLKECELQSIDCRDFHYKVSRLVESRTWGDYEVHESFVASDYSGIVMLMTDYSVVDSNFASKLIDITDYCKRQLKLKKKGERINEQLSA